MSMRIAFVYDFPYPWHAGGIEKIDKIESEGLAKEHEVHYYTMLWPGMRPEFTRNRVRFHAYWPASRETMYLHRRRSIRKAMMFALTSFRIYRERFDVVVIDAFPYLQIPIIRLYGLLTGCKVVMHVAEVWDAEYWRKYAGPVFGPLGSFFSNAVMRADAYIANSYDTKRRLQDIMHISPERIEVFAPVLDAALIESVRSKAKRRGNTIAFAGRFIKEKRLDKWLYEFAEVSRSVPRLHGLIIGDGPERVYIAKLTRALKLQDRVKLVKPIPTTRGLYARLSGCKALLNMSEREGLSIVTLESLSLGVPVVLPDYSPIPEDIKAMCVVEHEVGIPRALTQIMNSDSPGSFIRDRERLGIFQTSGVKKFYDRLFRKLGLSGR